MKDSVITAEAEENTSLADPEPQLITRSRIRTALSNPLDALACAPDAIKATIKYYLADDFTAFYLSETKTDVASNPAAAVGPSELYEEMADWQFNLLHNRGLSPDDRMLDIGCGVLRGGRRFIEYLDTGHYYGMDISAECLKEARCVLREEDLVADRPGLILNDDLRFVEPEFEGVVFDTILAQSVFTHLPPAQIRECLENVHRILSPDGSFYATYYQSEEPQRTVGGTGFEYPIAFFSDVASEARLSVRRLDVEHPNGLKTMEITQ